jgi:hypothetical protein
MSDTVTVRVCAVCGIVEPTKLWSGAKIVAGSLCAHKAWRPLLVRREDDDELTDLIARVLDGHIALGDEDDAPAPFDHYREVASSLVAALKSAAQEVPSSGTSRGGAVRAVQWRLQLHL